MSSCRGFKHFHNRCDLPHVEDGGLFDGHGVAFIGFGFHARASFCATEICSEVIRMASSSRQPQTFLRSLLLACTIYNIGLDEVCRAREGTR